MKGRKTLKLPQPVPLFPLAGALLLPAGQLPLNIFEPRYLRMVDDALASARVIGMIQPLEENAHEPPALYDVGCAGRITTFAETDEGRYLITLTGLRRFRILSEPIVDTPYRQAEVDWKAFEVDAHEDESGARVDRRAFLDVMHRYLDAEGLEADWDAARAAPIEALVASLAMGCPFPPNEKQALLEAETVAERAKCLTALMQMSGGDDAGGDQHLQ